jgi:hypothetical protein
MGLRARFAAAMVRPRSAPSGSAVRDLWLSAAVTGRTLIDAIASERPRQPRSRGAADAVVDDRVLSPFFALPRECRARLSLEGPAPDSGDKLKATIGEVPHALDTAVAALRELRAVG